jgi:hypothetical protein
VPSRTEDRAARAVERVLEGYAARGTIRELTRGAARGQRREWRFRWFRDREFRLLMDAAARSLRLEGALEQLPPRSALEKGLRAWLRSRQDERLPAHRRTDAGRVALQLRNGAAGVAILMRLHGEHWDYATRRMVHLLNELHVDHLPREAPLDWLVAEFALDPENPVWP